MPERAESREDPDAPLATEPTALALARLDRRFVFPPGGEALYRRIANLYELGEGQEFLVVACRNGVAAHYLAERTGAQGAGVDPDPALIDLATARARDRGMAGQIHFDAAPLTDLPYQDAVFDFTLAEIDVGAAGDPAAAVAEAARVTRAMGTVVLVQLVWTRKLEPEGEEAVVARLGVRPFLAMEWKQMLRDAGVVDLHVEDWSSAAVPQGQPPLVPGGLLAFFSLRGKLALVPSAFRRWGWRGVRTAFSVERDLRRWLLEENLLGVSVIKGTRWTGDTAGGGAARNRHAGNEMRARGGDTGGRPGRSGRVRRGA